MFELSPSTQNFRPKLLESSNSGGGPYERKRAIEQKPYQVAKIIGCSLAYFKGNGDSSVSNAMEKIINLNSSQTPDTIFDQAAAISRSQISFEAAKDQYQKRVTDTQEQGKVSRFYRELIKIVPERHGAGDQLTGTRKMRLDQLIIKDNVATNQHIADLKYILMDAEPAKFPKMVYQPAKSFIPSDIKGMIDQSPDPFEYDRRCTMLLDVYRRKTPPISGTEIAELEKTFSSFGIALYDKKFEYFQQLKKLEQDARTYIPAIPKDSAPSAPSTTPSPEKQLNSETKNAGVKVVKDPAFNSDLSTYAQTDEPNPQNEERTRIFAVTPLLDVARALPQVLVEPWDFKPDENFSLVPGQVHVLKIVNLKTEKESKSQKHVSSTYLAIQQRENNLNDETTDQMKNIQVLVIEMSPDESQIKQAKLTSFSLKNGSPSQSLALLGRDVLYRVNEAQNNPIPPSDSQRTPLEVSLDQKSEVQEVYVPGSSVSGVSFAIGFDGDGSISMKNIGRHQFKRARKEDVPPELAQKVFPENLINKSGYLIRPDSRESIFAQVKTGQH